MENRTASVERVTKETKIRMTLNLDGTGKSDIHTGIGFFDHMLDGFARHGLFDLSVSVDGDLDVDGGSRRQTGHPPLRRQNPSDGRDTGALGR